MKKNNRGITIVELLLVIALISILGAATIPVSSAMMVRSYLRDSRDELISSLFTARINSLTNKENSRWGVHTTTNQLVLFKGNDFASRDPDFDQVFTTANSVSFSPNDAVFLRNTGNVDSPPTFTVSSNTGDSYTITINSVGNIDVN